MRILFSRNTDVIFTICNREMNEGFTSVYKKNIQPLA